MSTNLADVNNDVSFQTTAKSLCSPELIACHWFIAMVLSGLKYAFFNLECLLKLVPDILRQFRTGRCIADDSTIQLLASSRLHGDKILSQSRLAAHQQLLFLKTDNFGAKNPGNL
ncbi:hypothetical protein BgiBS90_012758 [Biomphalaria glabrata]|nr:hypothetical protein BgiBS90_012758 [Biomphalaria glabrata]